MASPGDSANLQHNLTILAQLGTQEGKLSYSPSTGRFSIDAPSPIQGVIRMVFRDSVTSNEYFGKPIREVFAAAHAKAKGSDVAAALNGLKTLRNSYTEQGKLEILNEVIEDAERGVLQKDPRRAIEIRKKYQQYLKFGFAQAMFLPESNRGVCYSLTVHWARRILLGRTYFGVRKSSPLSEEKPPLTLNADQAKRIMKKMDIIRPLHAKVEAKAKEWNLSSGGTAMMAAIDADLRFKKYGELNIKPVMEQDQSIADTARGSEVMETVLGLAKTYRGATIFLLNLNLADGGHTIGIHLDGLLHFFDPNIGEFAFPTGFDKALEEFLDEWLERYSIKSFGLEGVSRSKVLSQPSRSPSDKSFAESDSD
jgi:hypothetical protein